MDKYFNPTYFWARDYLSMLRLKFIHVNKNGSEYYATKCVKTIPAEAAGSAITRNIKVYIFFQHVISYDVGDFLTIVQVTPYGDKQLPEPMQTLRHITMYEVCYNNYNVDEIHITPSTCSRQYGRIAKHIYSVFGMHRETGHLENIFVGDISRKFGKQTQYDKNLNNFV